MVKTMLCLVLLGSLAILHVAGERAMEQEMTVSKFKSDFYDVGDPRLCLEMDKINKFNANRFEVLPGIGWDNLRNVGKGQIIDYNYSKCLTTDDGKYLIPDQVFTIPLKTSFVDTFAEMIDTWHNASDSTSTTVNMNAGFSWGSFGISGKYSSEHTRIKKKQIEDKATTVRVQLRYYRYKSQLQPDSPLHKTFKRRLLTIAGYIQLNQMQMANYEAQLIVRDFGTHILTSVTAGAGLMKTDFLKRDYVASQSSDKTSVLASASASFGAFFNMGASYGHKTDSEDYKSYLKTMTHSYVTSHGGPILKAYNMSANDWTAGVDPEMVSMDRSGDPLSFLVTTQTLPELPVYLVNQVELIVRKAIMQYYEKNTIYGCTKLDSPNFSFSANMDDGSCEATATNMTFGGVYQTCTVDGQYLQNDPCSGLSQVNPKTRAASCSDPYTAVKLVTGRRVGKPEHRTTCRSCGFLWLNKCCDTKTYVATAVYTAYWCAGLGAIPRDSGYLYGGVYSAHEDNALTRTKGCPPSFYPRVFLDHYICISEDFEMGTRYSVPFGGFMSCSMGNPLSTSGVHPVGLQAPPPNSLMSFVMSEQDDSSSWPKYCPKGYSQHLVSIDNGCEVRYCLKSGSLSGPNLPSVKLPPYEDKPNIVGPQNSHVVFNMKTQVWHKEGQTDSGEETEPMKTIWTQHHDDVDYDKTPMAPGTAAAIAVGVTVFCGLLALVAFRAVQKRRMRNGVKGLSDDTQALVSDGDGTGAGGTGQGQYGSTGQAADSCSVELPTMS